MKWVNFDREMANRHAARRRRRTFWQRLRALLPRWEMGDM